MATPIISESNAIGYCPPYPVELYLTGFPKKGNLVIKCPAPGKFGLSSNKIMPVRKIPKNYTTITGLAYSVKSEELIGYEGPLEPHFIKLVSFNNNVLKYEEQPVRIEFTSSDAKKRSYTPDALVTYRHDIAPAKW